LTKRLAVLAAVICGGCPARSPSASNPEAVVRAYAQAVKGGRYGEAYDLMSLEFRRRYDRAEFERMLKENNDDARSGLKQLEKRPTEVGVAAELRYGEGDRLRLVVERGRWKIASNPINFYGQRTPAEALRSFVRAVERRRYDIVLRFVPARWAESMTVEKLRQQWEGEKKGEVASLLKSLKANLRTPIRITGDTATMPYGDKHEVRFVREDGAWKIEDPD